MAVERIMAEGTPGSGEEAPKLYIASNSGAVREHRVGPEPPPPVSAEDSMAAAIARVLSRQGEAGKPPPVERSQMPRSDFKDIVSQIKTLEKQDPGDPRLEGLRHQRDELRREVNSFGWFNPVKEELFDLYYDSRVKVDRDQKFGTDEWKRRTGGAPGRLELLKKTEEGAATESWEGNWLDEDRKSRGFWDSTQVQKVIDEYQKRDTTVTKEQLMGRYGGIIDDFKEESLKMIRAVVVDRHMFNRVGLDRVRNKHHLISDESYRNNGLSSTDANGNGLWDYEWTSVGTGETEYLKNFDAIRSLVEHERRKKYFIPNLGDYESYIKLVADDIEEVEEDIPYILSFFQYKFGTGEPKKIQEGYEEETRKLHKALEKFGMDLGYEREKPEFREFRRLSSKVDQNLKLLQTFEFSNLAYLDWQPYLQSGGDLGRCFTDNEYQDSIPDSILLDRDGLMLLALQEFERNNGEYWRYGSNNADTPLHFKEGDARAWQERRKDEMKENLMKKQLRTMDDLLSLTLDEHGRIAAYGIPKHPAFQRLKAEFDALDAKDTQEGKALVDYYGKPMTRWQEYCEKAICWQRNETFTEEITVKDKKGRDVKVTRKVFRIGDVRDYKQRVLFQHPLARSLTEEEFDKMYDEIDPDAPEFRKLRDEKKRKIDSIVGFSVDSVGTAERMARAFQEDASAGLARHLVSFAQMRAIGLIAEDVPQNYTFNKEGWPVDTNGSIITREVLHYALDLEGKPIKKDGRLIPEAVPHKVLLKHLCKLAMDRDWEDVEGNNEKQRGMRFKLSYVMKKMGITRSLPLFSNWYLGAHDTLRPNWLADIEKALPGFASLMKVKGVVRGLDSDDEFGGDEKTVLTRVIEDERELVEMMEVYIKDQFHEYFNYPGQDTRGGGNKEGRNLFLLPFGQSRGTVEMNGMIPHIWLGETDFLSSYGCDNWMDFIGLYKLSDEATYKAKGSLFETPRDAEYWFRRVGAIIEQQKLWISDSDKGKAVLNSGWGLGFFMWRAMNRAATFIGHKEHIILGSNNKDLRADAYTTLYDPEAAYRQLDERTYESYIKLAFQFLTPIMAIFEARQKLENVYGRSPGTAKFLNTMTWFALSRWMDTNYEEFRGKYGNALDVNLHMARKFIHTALFESKLIFSDEEWDQRMLGYTIPKNIWDEITTKNWSDMTEEEQDKLKERFDKLTEGVKKIPKTIRYQVDEKGNAIKYKKDSGGRVIFEKDSLVGENIPGIIDDFPPAMQKIILGRHNNHDTGWILPMGLNSEFPETLGTIKQMTKRETDSQGNPSKMAQIYLKLLHPEQFKIQTRERITVKRAA